jgi:ABC-2 type transport system ATP-binding protein
MLHIENLHKKYGDQTILDIKALDIPQGIVHLQGINGSGKTTFSKITAGLIPFAVKVVLHNKYEANKNKVEYRKQVTYAESEPRYPEFLTANDLIDFVGKAKSASSSQKNQFTKIFGINEYLYNAIGTYSSGMLKRLSLCLAFLGTPSLIVLDEPTNTLDAAAIKELIDQIHLAHEREVSFILVSHQKMQELGINVEASFLVANKTIGKI